MTLTETDIDKKILKTFDNCSEFYFPIVCQQEAKSFVKALFNDGVSKETLCEEVNECETTFTSWTNGLAKSGVGRKVIKRINKPLENYLWTSLELEELNRDVHKEIERIKDTKNTRLKVQKRILMGKCDYLLKQASTKSGGEKFYNQNVPKNEEDFKNIKLKKVGRTDLYEDKNEAHKENGEGNGKRNDKAREEEDEDDTKNVCVPIKDLIANFNQNSLKKESSASESGSTKSDDFEYLPKNCLKNYEQNQNASLVENNSNTATKNETNDSEVELRENDLPQEPCDENAGDLTSNYLYVFSDSSSCSGSPVRSHRFKVGLTECPMEELKRASQFNLDIKLISATAVCKPQKVLQALQLHMQEFKMKDNWYFCPLSKIIQSTSEAINQNAT